MQLHYDKHTEANYLQVHDRPIVGSEEVHPGIVLDFDDQGEVVAIEVRTMRDARSQGDSDTARDDQSPRSEPNTPLVRALSEARAQMRKSGIPFFSSWEEIEREVDERRGLPPEQRLR